MPVFLRYLATLLMHVMWHRIGGRGPVPPIRLPKKKPVTVPGVSAWQVMIALWLTKQLWAYGSAKVADKAKAKVKQKVRARMMNARHPLVRRLGSIGAGQPAATSPATETATPAPATPAPQAATATPAPASRPTPAAPAPRHTTRPLPAKATKKAVAPALQPGTGLAPNPSA